MTLDTSVNSSIVVVSGGMDSVTLLHHVVKTLEPSSKVSGRGQPLVLTFDYGQRHSKELVYAQAQAALLGLRHQVIDLRLLGQIAQSTSALITGSTELIPDLEAVLGDPQPVTYVPNRNMIMLSLAAAVAETRGATTIYIGVQRHDIYGYWDTTVDFMKRMNAVLALNRKATLTFQAPFADYSKTDELLLGTALGVDYGLTWSCYRGLEKACGVCPTCLERLQAFHNCGLEDPVPYYTPSEIEALITQE